MDPEPSPRLTRRTSHRQPVSEKNKLKEAYLIILVLLAIVPATIVGAIFLVTLLLRHFVG